jgi:hypothetical protein
MARPYSVWVQETTTRTAEVRVEIADDQDNAAAERLAQEQHAAGKLVWSEPKTCVRFSGFFSG